jgi:hypothetical protein
VAPRLDAAIAAVRTRRLALPSLLLLAALLGLLFSAGPAFAHAAHHPQSHHATAAQQHVTALPVATAHADHPALPCCRGATCVQLMPMPVSPSAGAAAPAGRPSGYPAARTPAATGLDLLPSPRPPKAAS